MTDTFLSLDRKVKLQPYLPPAARPIELLSDKELQQGVGGTLIVDTESYLNYFLVAFKCIRTGKYVRLEAIDANKSINPRQLSWIMHSYRTIGFNSIKYDLPMIWAAYNGFAPCTLQDISWKMISGVRLKEITEEYDFIIHKTNHIDIIEVCPHHGSLKLYGARLHSPRIQDLPFDVKIPLEQDQIPIVRDYNINDLDETERIFNFIQDRLELRQAMSIQYQIDLMSKSDAQIAETVINKEVHKLTGNWPKRSDIPVGSIYQYQIPSYIQYQFPILKRMLDKVRNARFKIGHYGIDLPQEINGLAVNINKATYRLGVGGLHSYEKNVSYRATDKYSIIDRDVASYYPTIILNQKLYPVSMGEEFLPAYASIKERRLEAKKLKKFTEDKGLKVVINGTFGKSNSIWSTVYSPQMFIQIVITGQLSLLMMIETVESIGIQVISANTDGLVMYCPQSLEEELKNVIEWWERTTNFQTEETRYTGYYARDVNNYFAVKASGEVKIKGSWAEVGSTSGTPLDNNPASLICTDAVVALLSKGIPIENTILGCQDIRRFVTVRQVKGGAHKEGYYLGKVCRWYYAKGIVGTLNYILTGNKIPDTDGAKPCMTLPEQFPSDINYQWYIDKTKEMLYDVAYMPRKEQLKFF